jgi:hypothetical protein
MFATTLVFASFWSGAWSAPLRAACVWLRRTPAPVVPPTPDALAPGWLRPLCVQRWVGLTVAARLAWMRQHPHLTAYPFAHESLPCWGAGAWRPYPRRELRELRQQRLLWLFGLEVERLLRIVQVPPVLVGEEDWTRAALGASEHLAQVYAELKRRAGARTARALVRDVLRRYITWQCPSEVA